LVCNPGLSYPETLALSIILTLKSFPGRGWGQGGEMNQALYAHMNNKRKMKNK
jgi:hypothetical protein